MEQTGKFSNGRAALGLLALVILAAAQLGAQLLASLPLMVGAPVWLGNVLAGVLYAALGVAGLLLLCGKGLRVTPEECRFAPVRLRPVWGGERGADARAGGGRAAVSTGTLAGWVCGGRHGGGGGRGIFLRRGHGHRRGGRVPRRSDDGR